MVQDRGALLTGLGVGAGLMYFLDPGRGRRRRAHLRDRITHSAHLGSDALGATRRDVANRAAGAAARVRGAFRRDPVHDAVLLERVRAQLGRVVSHAHALDVECEDGTVTLKGPILQGEAGRAMNAARRVRGVRSVVNALDEHREPGNVPSLQGGHSPREARSGVWQREWSPATRLLVGTTGTALTGFGALRRNAPGAILAATGVGLIARAATNLEASRLTGIGARRRAVDVQKTITVEAPVEDVYEFWKAYENFPRFMSRVLEVRKGADDRQSHWTVAGPGGARIHFDAVESAMVPYAAIGWRTVEGAPVAHAGLVRFERAGDARTRVHIRMSYNPPGGWFGHGVAAVFGVDPKSSLDGDLARMKTLLETGRPPRDAARPDVH